MKEYKWLVCNALCEIGVLSDFFTQKTKKSQCKMCDTSKFLKFYRKKGN